MGLYKLYINQPNPTVEAQKSNTPTAQPVKPTAPHGTQFDHVIVPPETGTQFDH